MRNNVFKILLLVGVLVALAVGVSLLFPDKPSSSLKPFPNPNGYNTAIEAAKLLSGPVPDYQKLNHEELAALTEANSNALQFVRIALTQEFRVPIQFSQSYYSSHVNDLPAMKDLASALAAEGRLAEMENHPDIAAHSYLDAIQLGSKSARGGILIHSVVATAVEAIGTTHLQRIVPQLDQTTCRDLAATLEKIDADRVTWKELINKEREWTSRTSNLRQKIAALLPGNSLATVIKKIQGRYDTQQSSLRHLMIQLAARAYELENGVAAKSVSDLVPAYLKTIPKDPVTGTNIVYLP